MNSTKFEKEASIAAKWWRDNIGLNAKQDNGDLFQSVFFSFFSGIDSITEEQKESFELYLKERLIQELNQFGSAQLKVDYGPCEILSYAAMNSGVRDSMFPMKTTMTIEKGSVVVKNGYVSELEEIYSDKVPPQPC